jgi:prevent-host-death family protein
MATPVFTISRARQKFFDLFERVTSGHGRKVIITSRGVAHQAVLVGEDYLNDLESAARKLRDLESGRATSAGQFRLLGSGKAAEDVDDPLLEPRAQANELFEKKLKSFAKSS